MNEATTTENSSTPAGWYDDGTGRQRWFDGTAWGQYASDDESAPLNEATTTENSSMPAGWYDDGTGRQRWFDGTAWGQYAPDGESAPQAAYADSDSGSGSGSGSGIVRRTRRTPFEPPPAEPAADHHGLTVSRNWGLGLRSANEKKDSGLTRNRRVAGDLPQWTPLPPGELSVQRGTGRTN